MDKKMVRKGFTIIELVLAIGFVSILMLAVSILTIRVSGMYEKGATVRSINQVGREVLDVMRRDFSQADNNAVSVTTKSHGLDIYSVCLGSVSYIANSSAILQEREKAGNTDGLAMRQGVSQPIGLVRVVDKTKLYCGPDRATWLKQVDQAADELLVNSSMKLAIHNMRAAAVVTSTRQSLYRINLIVGTNSGDSIDSANRCRVASNAPEDANADYNYCSVAELTTIMRTGGTL